MEQAGKAEGKRWNRRGMVAREKWMEADDQKSRVSLEAATRGHKSWHPPCDTPVHQPYKYVWGPLGKYFVTRSGFIVSSAEWLKSFRGVMVADDLCWWSVGSCVAFGRVENRACWAIAALMENGTQTRHIWTHVCTLGWTHSLWQARTEAQGIESDVSHSFDLCWGEI